MSSIFKSYFNDNKFFFKLKRNGPTRMLTKSDIFEDGYKVFHLEKGVYSFTGDYYDLQRTFPTVFKYTKYEFDKYLKQTNEVKY